VCYAGILDTGKGEEQDHKTAAIKRLKYTFVTVSAVTSAFVRKGYTVCILSESDLSVLLGR
jgi:hypothetical protein